MPEALKKKLKGRRALHIHEYNRAKQANHSGDISGIPHWFHPVFATHPDTVERLAAAREPMGSL